MDNPRSEQFDTGAIGRVRRHWSGTWRGGLLLCAVCLILHLPGTLVLPPIDRDESRFAEATRQMLMSDSWRGYIVPVVEDTPRLNKPPLTYWLQAASVRLVGGGPDFESGALPTGGIVAYRLPSLLGALIAVLLTWRLGVALFAGPVGWLAGALLASCTLIMVDVRQARADEILLACTVAAQLSLWHIWHHRRHPGPATTRWSLLLWVAVGFGVLAKGPVTPAVVGLTCLCLCLTAGEWRWVWRLRPSVGGIIVLLMVGPWVLLVTGEVGWGEYWRRSIVDEILGRSVVARESHWGPPGYYVALLPIMLWPGSLALVPAACLACRRGLRFGRPPGTSVATAWRRLWRLRSGRDAECFCVAWVIPTWLLFEIVSTKLPHYALPVYPALVLLCARALCARRAIWTGFLGTRAGRVAVGGWVVLSFGMALLLPLVMASCLRTEPGLPAIGAIIIILPAIVALLVVVVRSARRQQFLRAQLYSIVLAAVALGGTFQFTLPAARALWLSSRMWREITVIDEDVQRPLAAADYHEDSLVFLSRGRVARISWWELPDWLAGHPNGLAVTERKPYLAIPGVRELVSIRGLNYSNGRWQELVLIEADRQSVSP